MHNKSQQQYNNYNYTSVHMNMNTNGNEYFEKKKCNDSSCSSASSSFFQYLFSSRSVPAKLLMSLIPPYGPFKTISTDYEGSLLNIILLVIVLYNRVWRDGKLIVFLSPIIYVGIVTLGISGISKMTKTKVTLRELFCLISYGLFGHTLALLVSNLSPELFIPSLIVFGGLDSVRICCVLLLRTRIPPYRFVVCTPITIIHWLYLLFLELKSN